MKTPLLYQVICPFLVVPCGTCMQMNVGLNDILVCLIPISEKAAPSW